jgi:hypothetical protein
MEAFFQEILPLLYSFFLRKIEHGAVLFWFQRIHLTRDVFICWFLIMCMFYLNGIELHI